MDEAFRMKADGKGIDAKMDESCCLEGKLQGQYVTIFKDDGGIA